MTLSSTAREFGSGVAALYRRYAEWLVSITWKRFIVLSILLMIVTGILSDLPPFNWDVSTRTSRVPSSRSVDITVDDQGVRIKPKKKNSTAPEITIDENGVRIKRRSDAGKPPQEIIIDEHGVQKRESTDWQPQPPKPPKPQPGSSGSSFSDDIRREVIEPIKRDLAEVRRQALEDAAQARRDAAQARRDAAQARGDGTQDVEVSQIRRDVMDALSDLGTDERVVHIRVGNYLPQLAFLFILLSMAIKIAYARTVKAEAKAAEAHHTAEEESLKRQVVEARMSAMQAQVEPHFLFNTLASIDHLIETDPARASQMQKNLIALLRASMPAMREKSTNLGRELDVVRPYLEILKVRMGERLQPQVAVSEGLYSADFPPMMLQSLVENAIKHGLEPKAEGGSISVGAEVVHGKLAVSVADSGVGFGKAATAGTGTGLTNIRERLKLIYGDDAELKIADNTPSGTRVTIVVPYKAK
jgi:Histidine kinase